MLQGCRFSDKFVPNKRIMKALLHNLEQIFLDYIICPFVEALLERGERERFEDVQRIPFLEQAT